MTEETPITDALVAEFSVPEDAMIHPDVCRRFEARVASLEGALTETIGAIQALKDSKAIQFVFCDGSRQSDLTHPYIAGNHALRVLERAKAALGGEGGENQSKS
jgi:hypothetical protein